MTHFYIEPEYMAALIYF